MKYFLLEYHQGTGELKLREFSDRLAALRARLDCEETHDLDPQVEIVVLGARSEADLRRTHSRYFQSVEEMLVR